MQAHSRGHVDAHTAVGDDGKEPSGFLAEEPERRRYTYARAAGRGQEAVWISGGLHTNPLNLSLDRATAYEGERPPTDSPLFPHVSRGGACTADATSFFRSSFSKIDGSMERPRNGNAESIFEVGAQAQPPRLPVARHGRRPARVSYPAFSAFPRPLSRPSPDLSPLSGRK